MRNKELSEAKNAQDQEDAFFFLNKEARVKLPHFQYKGQDQSLIYNYVLSPLAGFLVNNCTPPTIAPNTITLFGLCFMIVSYASLWYYAPLVDNYASLDPDSERLIVPSWVFLYQACAMLIYQTLDNMDGKQARKTNSSSPLGLLFDHGCDAINVIFGTAGWLLGLGLTFRDDPVHCMALIAGTFSMFYIATWEEYFTGEMILPMINGPTEGVAGGALVSLITCFYGTEWWQSTSVATALGGLNELLQFELRNADLLVGLACFGMLREGLSRTIFVYRRHGGIQTLVAQLPLWILFVAGPLGSGFWFRMPRTTINLGSGLMVEAVTQMMLDHITEQPFNPLLRQRFVLIPLLALLCFPEPNETTDVLMLIYTTAVWTYIFVKIRLVVHEICVTLNLKCFDISSKNNSSSSSSSTTKQE